MNAWYDISRSDSSYSSAISHYLSNDSQNFGDSDNIAGNKNKAEDSDISRDISPTRYFTILRRKTPKPKLGLKK